MNQWNWYIEENYLFSSSRLSFTALSVSTFCLYSLHSAFLSPRSTKASIKLSRRLLQEDLHSRQRIRNSCRSIRSKANLSHHTNVANIIVQQSGEDDRHKEVRKTSGN